MITCNLQSQCNQTRRALKIVDKSNCELKLIILFGFVVLSTRSYKSHR